MKKIFLYCFVLLMSTFCYCQNRISYINKSIFTTIVTVTESTFPADNLITVNVFNGSLDKVEWGNAISIISYKYLGIDNQNNLHIRRIDSNYSIKKTDECDLIFKLNSEGQGEITLIGQTSLKEPLPIHLKIEATNNFLKSKYFGNLPLYVE